MAMELGVMIVKLDRQEENIRRVGVRTIAAKLKIPSATLNNRVIGKVEGFKHRSGGQNKLFTEEQEQELAQHVDKHADSGFPFTPKQVRQVAFEFRVSLGLKEDDMETELLSRMWYKRFLKRVENLSERTPQQLAQLRVRCANRETVKKFFTFLEEKYLEKSMFHPHQVWKVEETGLVDIPKIRRVVCGKRKKCN